MENPSSLKGDANSPAENHKVRITDQSEQATKRENEGKPPTTSKGVTVLKVQKERNSIVTSQAGEKERAADEESKASTSSKGSLDLDDLPLFRTKSTGKPDKGERKAARKLSKMMALVANQLGAERSPEPTEWTVIWGAGLGLGTPKSTVIDFFSPSPKEVRFYAEKPYCAAKFETSKDAEIAKDTKNGLEILPTQPIYVGFLGEEPPAEDLSLLDCFEKRWPSGLTLIADFVTEEEEDALIQWFLPHQAKVKSTSPEKGAKRDILSDINRINIENEATLKKRTVQHFGYEFRYDTNDVDYDNPMEEGIPDFMIPYIVRMMTHSVLFRKPDQVTMNHYLPGQGIPPHVDTHSVFEAPIVSLSFGAPVIMDFRDQGEHVAVYLPRRSLLIMKEEARLLWTHGIAGRTFDVVRDHVNQGLTVLPRQERISLTFRLLNYSRVCECNYPQMCDSQKAKMTEEIAVEVEKDLVHRVYDEIAPHFSATRHTPWPKVKEFIESIAPGQSLLDVGCGNGKYFNLTDYIYEVLDVGITGRVGTDMSRGLLEIAQKEKSVDGVRANCLNLPFRDESFDAVICIAVLHHLATQERRVEALREVVRVLSPGGQALIYVWAKSQRLKEVKSNYSRQQALKAGRDPDAKPSRCKYPLRNYSFLPIHNHEEDFRSNDMIVPWLSGDKDKSTIHHRFYHVFDRGELENLLKELDPPPRILDSYYDEGNWCVRMQKQSPEVVKILLASKPKTICDDIN